MRNLHLPRCWTWSAFLFQLSSYLRERLEDNLCPATASSGFEPRLCLFLSLPSPAFTTSPVSTTVVDSLGLQDYRLGLGNPGMHKRIIFSFSSLLASSWTVD